MIRNLKVMALAFAAVLAVSAVGASAASAFSFHSSEAATTISGKQTEQHVFTVKSGTVKCTTATFSGTTTEKTVEEVTLAPTYAGCKAFGLAAPVDVNGCAFIFTATGEKTVTSDVECKGATKFIAVTAPGCEVRVGPQVGLNTITLTNAPGPPKTINATINVAGIHYEEIGASCNSAGTHVDGTYVGAASLNGGTAEIWYE